MDWKSHKIPTKNSKTNKVLNFWYILFFLITHNKWKKKYSTLVWEETKIKDKHLIWNLNCQKPIVYCWISWQIMINRRKNYRYYTPHITQVLKIESCKVITIWKLFLLLLFWYGMVTLQKKNHKYILILGQQHEFKK